jgi:hypothetical protein
MNILTNRAVALAPAAAQLIRSITAGIRLVTRVAFASDAEMTAIEIQRHGADRILAPLPTIAHGFWILPVSD